MRVKMIVRNKTGDRLAEKEVQAYMPENYGAKVKGIREILEVLVAVKELGGIVELRLMEDWEDAENRG